MKLDDINTTIAELADRESELIVDAIAKRGVNPRDCYIRQALVDGCFLGQKWLVFDNRFRAVEVLVSWRWNIEGDRLQMEVIP